MNEFILDPRLENDCVHLGDLNLCRIMLMKDANYPWLILVPMRKNVSEIYELEEEDQEQLVWESSFVAKRMRKLFQSDKMNVAALGNVVSQLHIHHVSRHRGDRAWPDPVWGKVSAKAYTKVELIKRCDALQQTLNTSVFKPASLENV